VIDRVLKNSRRWQVSAERLQPLKTSHRSKNSPLKTHDIIFPLNNPDSSLLTITMKFELPDIPQAEQTPVVKGLLAIIEQLIEHAQKQQEEIE